MNSKLIKALIVGVITVGAATLTYAQQSSSQRKVPILASMYMIQTVVRAMAPQVKETDFMQNEY